MKRTFLLFIYTLLASSIFAYDFEANGLYFNITSSTDKTVEITRGDERYGFAESITLPTTVNYRGIDFNVTKIGDGAFSLASICGMTIPASIKSIGYRAFYTTSGYNHPSYYIIFNGDISIDSEAFNCSWYCNFIFTQNTVPTVIGNSEHNSLINTEPVMCIRQDADSSSFLNFAYRGSVIRYEDTIDVSLLKKMAQNQFKIEADNGNFRIKSLVAPYKAELYETWVYYDKSDPDFDYDKIDKTTVTLPLSTTYEGRTFQVNSFSPDSERDLIYNIETLIIPEGFKDMKGTVGNCSTLKKIILPSTLEELTNTFNDCPNLETVISYIKEPFETNAFNTNIISLFTTLYVPDNSIDNYKTTSSWNQFSSIQPLSASGVFQPSIDVTELDGVMYYTLDGRQIEKAQKGINLVRYKNGRVSKLIIP